MCDKIFEQSEKITVFQLNEWNWSPNFQFLSAETLNIQKRLHSDSPVTLNVLALDRNVHQLYIVEMCLCTAVRTQFYVTHVEMWLVYSKSNMKIAFPVKTLAESLSKFWCWYITDRQYHARWNWFIDQVWGASILNMIKITK